MSDTNRTKILFSGVLSNVSPFAFDAKLINSSDLSEKPEFVTSEVIRSDRQVSDLVLVDKSVGGAVEVEASYSSDNNLLGRIALMPSGVPIGSYASRVEGSLSVSGTNWTKSGATLTADGAGATNSHLFGAGDWIKIPTGNAAPWDYGFYKIIDDAGAPSSYVLHRDIDEDVTVLSGEVIQYAGIRDNGQTHYPFKIEKQYLDIGVYEYMTGVEIDSMSVSISSGAIATVSYDFIGETYQVSNTSQNFPELPSTIVYGPSTGASDSILLLNDQPLDMVTDASFTLSNNLRELKRVGKLGTESVGAGECSVTGSISMYFEDKTQLQRLLDNEQFSLSFGYTSYGVGGGNTGGNAIIYDFPAVKFSSGTPDISGKNSDVMVTLEWTAFRHPTAGYTVRMSTMSA